MQSQLGDLASVSAVLTIAHRVLSCEARAQLAAWSTLCEPPAEAQLYLLTTGGLIRVRRFPRKEYTFQVFQTPNPILVPSREELRKVRVQPIVLLIVFHFSRTKHFGIVSLNQIAQPSEARYAVTITSR